MGRVLRTEPSPSVEPFGLASKAASVSRAGPAGASAVISPCGLYRYRLARSIGGFLAGPSVAWIMVNPSTADAETDDATIRKVIGFSERLGFGEIVVGNLFAYRATDIRALRTAADPIGPFGGDHLRAIMLGAEKVIVAWGPCAKLPRWLRNRWMEVAGIAEANRIPLWCLGTAQDGHPLHPLMQSYNRPLRLWQRPDAAQAIEAEGQDDEVGLVHESAVGLQSDASQAASQIVSEKD